LKNLKLTCLFVHFNSKMRIEPYVLTYLEHLSNIGFEILFISNSPVQPDSRQELGDRVKNYKIFERENKGADFGAWKWAIENNIIPGDADYLLLTNDSILGPLFPLTPIFESMLALPETDFWGLTDNYHGGWHLQSYFVCFTKKVFTSAAFKNVFKPDFGRMTKQEIIKQGEVQLTAALVNAGFKGAAYIPYQQINPDFEHWDVKNSTHLNWDQLIEQFNFPFVKKELILQNPENIQNTDKIFSLVQKYGFYNAENIKKEISHYLSLHDATHSFPNKISVLCHLYYPGSIYYFMTRLFTLKSPQTQFIFNLSTSLYHNSFVLEMLEKFFPGAIILYTPNQGRDIGGKVAAFEAFMRSGIESDYTLIIHDKLSPHTPTGVEWRNKLLRIINPTVLEKIFRKFSRNNKAGIITTSDFIENEYDTDRNIFTCTSSDNLFYFINKYKLHVTDYKFAAGTIFWIRTSILRHFFSTNSPLSVRKEFEKGNSLDFDKGTNIHAWERLFSFITHSQGFKTIGI
jgi:lipopolysaccharide biosynthesis protein